MYCDFNKHVSGNRQIHPIGTMLSFNVEEIIIDITTQMIYDQQIACGFDYLKSLNAPSYKMLILRLTGFGVVNIIKFDPIEAQVGEIVLKIT